TIEFFYDHKVEDWSHELYEELLKNLVDASKNSKVTNENSESSSSDILDSTTDNDNKDIYPLFGALDMKVYMLNIVAKELYIFQEIANFVLPSRLQEYNPDILIDKNFNNYDMMINGQFNLSNSPPPDETKLTFDFEKSPQRQRPPRPFVNTRKT
ncbi:12220_t:CDS:2, partial [Dentiscutata erythropus]